MIYKYIGVFISHPLLQQLDYPLGVARQHPFLLLKSNPWGPPKDPLETHVLELLVAAIIQVHPLQ